MTEEQLDLPFDFIEAEKHPDWSWLPRFEHPHNDNEWLMNDQWEYRNNNSQEALADLYARSLVICGKLVSKEAMENKHIRQLSVKERMNKANDAAGDLIIRLMRRPRYYVARNMPAALYNCVRRVLYYQRKIDKIIDFVDFDSFYKEGENDEMED